MAESRAFLPNAIARSLAGCIDAALDEGAGSDMVAFCFNTFNRSAYLGVDPDLPGQIAAAAKAGFTLIGPDMFSISAWAEAGNSLEKLADLIASNGLQCWEIAAGLVVSEREATLKAAEQVAQAASILKPRWIQANAATAPSDEARETFGLAAEIVASAGAGIAVEYLPIMEVNDIASTLALIGTVEPERAGVMVDTWHHFRGPDRREDLESLPAERLAYVQFDDALPLSTSDLAFEMLDRRTFPGEGEFDLADFCAILRKKGFDGVVSVEVLSAELRELDPFEFAKRALQTSKIFW